MKFMGSILQKISSAGLKLATEREMTFFGLTCAGEAYVRLLSQEFGFSYQAVGILAQGNHLAFLLNEPRIIHLTEEHLARSTKFKKNSLIIASKIVQTTSRELTKALAMADRQPKAFFEAVLGCYPKFFLGLGIYNLYWRFLGNETEKLSTSTLKKIARGRNEAAALYARVEAALMQAVKQIQLPATVVWQTYRELQTGSTLTKAAALRRAKSLIYFCDETEEIVSTNSNTIATVKKRIFSTTAAQTVTGFPAYQGVVTGKVYNIFEGGKLPDRFILVANTTNPHHLPLIKKSIAIVADEGGVLSHAAIIARESKIPCVVGVKNGTKVFKTGDLVEVDANKGIVTKL